jgi:hypothetical protein
VPSEACIFHRLFTPIFALFYASLSYGFYILAKQQSPIQIGKILSLFAGLFLKNLRTKDNEKLTGILYLLMALLHKQEDDSAGILDL